MKKSILSALFAGLTAAAYGQGQINLDNNANIALGTGLSTAITNGLVFVLNAGVTTAINHDFGLAIYGGTDSANLTLLKSFSGTGAALDNVAGAGTFTDISGSAATIAGAAGTTAFFVIEAWSNPQWTTYAQAFAANDFVGKTLAFANPVSQLPNAPPDFVAMPALVLSAVPEPSTFALAGLGAAALLIFRRRK